MESSFEWTGGDLEAQDFGQRQFEVPNPVLVLVCRRGQFDSIVPELANAQDEFGLAIYTPTLRVAHNGVNDLLICRLEKPGRPTDFLDYDGAGGQKCLGSGAPWKDLDRIDRVVGIGWGILGGGGERVGGRRE